MGMPQGRDIDEGQNDDGQYQEMDGGMGNNPGVDLNKIELLESYR
jgi:hypothetical protein